jgi:hypothetical protein
MQTMRSLIERAKDAYKSAPGSVKVSPSIPILYFGDYEAFRKSDRRIVTVGLNPGAIGFPENDPWQKFPAYNKSNSYQKAWNQYFQIERPKEQWFSDLDCMLHGFDASFYNGQTNTALHTDLLSPVATAKPWSKLTSSVKKELSEKGMHLWHDLISFLEPHIILISVAEQHLQKISFGLVQEQQTVFVLNETKDGQRRHRPYVVLHSVWRLSGSYETDVLFGQAAQTPFGTLPNEVKKRIGKVLKKTNALRNWKAAEDPTHESCNTSDPRIRRLLEGKVVAVERIG